MAVTHSHTHNEVKRSWMLKSTKIVPVIIGETGMIKKNLIKIRQTILGNITTNELQVGGCLGLSYDPEKSPWNKTENNTASQL